MEGRWHIDWAGERTLANWMVNYDLVCAESPLISSFAMALFLGFASGALFLPSLAHKYGMKNFF